MPLNKEIKPNQTVCHVGGGGAETYLFLVVPHLRRRFRTPRFFLVIFNHWLFRNLSALFIYLFSFYFLFAVQLRYKTILPTPKKRKSDALDVTQNCIWWCRCIYGDLGNVVYPFIIITGRLWPGVVVPVRIPSMSQIEISNLLETI